ncbi:ABC transporter ATP-binding protein [Rhodoferax aquaticus]|uniref:ATP-binding cassette domain-containing protein n=1 Tax=Rhodoferax aquaticus TaxID=2527691 RepID=A0A515EKV4_9BURK|nr:ATP-binding cassette domain-containing protein [Rhodoferax aquaticus]QDL53295.1 ATP-binding cassette domain-containing protein [Rhodoferax aquaticus]
MLSAQGLGFSGPNGPVFAQFNLQLRPGVCLVQGGESRGKTTLLRLLAGELQAQHGHVRLHLEAGVLDAREHAAAYRDHVVWTEPRSTAYDATPVSAYLQTMRQHYPRWSASLLDTLTQALDLEPHWDKPLYMLSTGSKRKVWWATALASGAELALVDEPFAALDFASIRILTAHLQTLVTQSHRIFVLADYAAPAGLVPTQVVDLGD